ncbi:hypothetical protein N431DRAFT_515263 [Stipitochalara longipes BDJ]|nr:hypothetical protein N431DRAFT_515263 [Stipitochalara longipes BDJ]
MIGTSTAEHIFIRSCILFLHNIAPASLFYCLLLYLLPTALSVYVYLPFFTIFFLPYKYHLQRPAIHPELPSREERAKLFKRCNTTFLGAEEGHIKRENVKEFIRWAFLNAGQAENEDEDKGEVEGYVDAMEKLLGRDIPLGKVSAKGLRLTVDKVDCLHRSLLWYLCVFVVDTIMFWSMLYNSFHFHRTSLARFFKLFPFFPLTLLSAYRSPTRLPVLFIHGISIRLYPYTSFLRDLNSAGAFGGGNAGVGIIALEIMPMSSRITHPALEKDVMVHEVHDIVKHHGWSRFILVSHSYGSIISTHLLKSPITAPLIRPIVLVDPVSFLLHLPDVAYNFTARQPVRANEHQLWYFGSKNMGVAHSLARKFFWSQNIVWKEDLGVEEENGEEGKNVTVVLSGRDLIVDTEPVRRYLTASFSEGLGANRDPISMTNRNGKGRITKVGKEDTGAWTGGRCTESGLEVLWFEHLDHAQVFDFKKTRESIIKAIALYAAKG